MFIRVEIGEHRLKFWEFGLVEIDYDFVILDCDVHLFSFPVESRRVEVEQLPSGADSIVMCIIALVKQISLRYMAGGRRNRTPRPIGRFRQIHLGRGLNSHRPGRNR